MALSFVRFGQVHLEYSKLNVGVNFALMWMKQLVNQSVSVCGEFPVLLRTPGQVMVWGFLLTQNYIPGTWRPRKIYTSLSREIGSLPKGLRRQIAECNIV
jgi:hypothetical protein